MERIVMALLALVLSLPMAACKQAPQSSTPPILSLPRPGVQLLATPADGRNCDTGRMRIHFDWNLGAIQDPATSDAYDLHVDSPIGPAFAHGGRTGHGETGNWAHPGQWFFLVNRRTREVVAALRIGPDTCA